MTEAAEPAPARRSPWALALAGLVRLAVPPDTRYDYSRGIARLRAEHIQSVDPTQNTA